MKFDVRYANHPDDSKRYDITKLRRHYRISNIDKKDAANRDGIPTADLR